MRLISAVMGAGSEPAGNGGCGVADAGFGIGFRHAEFRSQRFARRHQSVELGALARNDVRQNARRGEIGAVRSGHADRNENQFIRQVAIERETLRLHWLQLHIGVGRNRAPRDRPVELLDLRQRRGGIHIACDHQDRVVGRVPILDRIS